MAFIRIALVWLVVLLYAGLIPAAYADPPDPLWMTGYWDHDDFDDAIVFITAFTALDGLGPVSLVPLFVLAAYLTVRDAVAPSAPAATIAARAPPLRASTSC